MRITQIINPIAVFVRRLFRCYRPEMSRLAALSQAADYWNRYAEAINKVTELQSALQKETRAREELHAHKLSAIVGVGVLQKLRALEDSSEKQQKSIGTSQRVVREFNQ